MDRVLKACDEIGDLLDLKISTGIMGGIDPQPVSLTTVQDAENSSNARKTVVPRWKLEDVLANGVQDAKLQLK
jgi:serine palmitoyltransferase